MIRKLRLKIVGISVIAVAVLLVILLPAALGEGLRRAGEKGREKRQWAFIRARYYGGR